MKRSGVRLAVKCVLLFSLMSGSFVAGVLADHRFRLPQALEYLRAAQHELSREKDSCGGYRDKALHEVREAIHDVLKGIEHEEREKRRW